MKPTLFAAAFITLPLAAAEQPPLIWTDPVHVASTADGDLRPVVGVQNIQVYRANRTAPAHADGLKDSYSHQPMLAWWHGKFYLEYLSGPRDESQAPCVTSLTTSTDGVTWEKPRVIFPAFDLPNGTQTITHQRMGFHVAPKDGPLDKLGAGRLLVLAFYGKAPSPNDGTGIGRAVREIHDDGTLGPIYFIRFNAKQPFPNFTPPYPLYTASPDRGFVAACEALLANKLMTAQWWEEDQLDESDFYRVKGKAMSYVHRPDGSVLAVWKNALVATTNDNGESWTQKQFATNLPNNGSKYNLQRTSDGRYALFLNPTNRLRFPLAVLTSDDCEHFSDLLTIHAEVPDQRFPGAFKSPGPQYVRGIAEGNGTPPDGATWMAYSVNKEDIWIARVPVPIRSRVEEAVNDDFEKNAAGAIPAGWNVYSPIWAPVRVVEAGGAAHRAMELRDEDPYDYARAIRVFPEARGVKLTFKILARQTNARCEIDITDGTGNRPFAFALGEDGHMWACHEGVWTDNGAYAANQWIAFSYSKKPTSDRGELTLDGKQSNPRSIGPVEAAETIERVSFRTGVQRLRGYGAGYDLPGADAKVPAAAFLVDDVVIEPRK